MYCKNESPLHQVQDLVDIFAECFYQEYQTRLVFGTDEPLYLPKSQERADNQIIFAHGFFRSALHECAHWLLAGATRRQQEDYGYWYAPDGRSAAEQAIFEQVEVKPQALEFILAMACAYPFGISLDNLQGERRDSRAFQQAILQQVKVYCQQGLPKRARRFRTALCQFYQTNLQLDYAAFCQQEIA